MIQQLTKIEIEDRHGRRFALNPATTAQVREDVAALGEAVVLDERALPDGLDAGDESEISGVHLGVRAVRSVRRVERNVRRGGRVETRVLWLDPPERRPDSDAESEASSTTAHGRESIGDREAFDRAD